MPPWSHPHPRQKSLQKAAAAGRLQSATPDLGLRAFRAAGEMRTLFSMDPLRYSSDMDKTMSEGRPAGARAVVGPSALVAINNEPPARLIVDAPLPEPLANGLVFIQYRTENLRVLPVFGQGALDVSPRIGHIHVTVDDAPWHFIDASGETVVVVGLEAGPHTVLIELADPAHRVMASETVSFTLPRRKGA